MLRDAKKSKNIFSKKIAKKRRNENWIACFIYFWFSYANGQCKEEQWATKVIWKICFWLDVMGYGAISDLDTVHNRFKAQGIPLRTELRSARAPASKAAKSIAFDVWSCAFYFEAVCKRCLKPELPP